MRHINKRLDEFEAADVGILLHDEGPKLVKAKFRVAYREGRNATATPRVTRLSRACANSVQKYGDAARLALVSSIHMGQLLSVAVAVLALWQMRRLPPLQLRRRREESAALSGDKAKAAAPETENG